METRAIVIVEDNGPIASLLQEVLNDVPGYGAVTVTDAAIALDVVTAVHPDLVIMDVDLPGIDGFDLLEMLRRHPHERTASVPVLLMSAAHHADEARQRDVPFVSKPFDLDDFLAVVHDLLGHAPESLP